MLFTAEANSEKKTLYFDVEDILFSTQYIMLSNLASFAKKDNKLASMIMIILDHMNATGRSVFQNIMHRNEEEFITQEDFTLFIPYVIENNLLDGDDLNMDTPYSKFMKNMVHIATHSNIVCIYDNLMQEQLAKARLHKHIDGTRFLSTEEFLEKEVKGIIAGESGIYTGRASLVRKLLEKKIPISIMYPDTLKYMKEFKNVSNCAEIINLWDNVE